jgi:hypothetical protein
VVVIAGTARADEHQMVVSEVMLSTGGDARAQLIELHDTGDELFPAPAYSVEVFDAEAVSLGTIATPGISGGNGPTFYLVTTPQADAALGVTGDTALNIALPVDGQACFIGTAARKVHCIAWGCVNQKVTPATPLGASPSDGDSLQRTPSGAALTVAAPTPGGANTDGAMDDPCPVAPMPDGTPGDSDPSGGCCDSGSGGGIGACLMLGLIALTTRKRRSVG